MQEARFADYDWHRKSSGARSQVCRSVRTNTQAVLRLAWDGLAKGKPRQASSLRGLGLGLPEAWGPGLGAGAPRSLEPGFSGTLGPAASAWANFRRSEKSPGGRQAKGWETAETARKKRRGFSPSPLLKPSNTPPKVGG